MLDLLLGISIQKTKLVLWPVVDKTPVLVKICGWVGVVVIRQRRKPPPGAISVQTRTSKDERRQIMSVEHAPVPRTNAPTTSIAKSLGGKSKHDLLFLFLRRRFV